MHYRAAAEGFARIDRPVMLSMCLGMVADFDERAGDYAAAITALEAAIATNESLRLGGFTGSLLARLGWVLLHDGESARAEAVYERALDVGPPAAAHAGDVPRPHRHGRAAPARTAATTPRPRRPPKRWSSTAPADPRRFRNRVDPDGRPPGRRRGVLRRARR